MTTKIWAAALVTIACAGMGQAAEKIRYEDIPEHLAAFGSVLDDSRGFRGLVVTLDGKKHRGGLRFESDRLEVFRGNLTEDLPSEQISRIEIGKSGRYSHRIAESAEIPLIAAGLACGGWSWEPAHISPKCFVPVMALFSPVWIYTAVTAPFYLVADGVAFLIPPKIYEIVH